MCVGINSVQAHTTDNKPNFPGPLPSRLFIFAVSILSSPLISYRHQVQSIVDIYPAHGVYSSRVSEPSNDPAKQQRCYYLRAFPQSVILPRKRSPE